MSQFNLCESCLLVNANRLPHDERWRQKAWFPDVPGCAFPESSSARVSWDSGACWQCFLGMVARAARHPDRLIRIFACRCGARPEQFVTLRESAVACRLIWERRGRVIPDSSWPAVLT